MQFVFIRCSLKCFSFSLRSSHSWNVMFFGSDEFSLQSLKKVHNHMGHQKLVNKLEVVTSVKQKLNPVAEYSKNNNITVHSWQPSMTMGTFNIGIVVSFGYLIPESIINQFPLGIVNVHASLLPRWRGAAPIIHAIKNGDQQTGISIMRIKPKKFDTGQIVMQKTCNIGPDELMPALYERLSKLGADCLLETMSSLPHCLEHAKDQLDDRNVVTYAPRLRRIDALVRWEEMSSSEVYNLYRSMQGLFDLQTSWHSLPVKLIGVGSSAQRSLSADSEQRELCAPGAVHYCRNSNLLYICCKGNTWAYAKQLKVGGKQLKPIDFYNGYMNRVPVNKRYFDLS